MCERSELYIYVDTFKNQTDHNVVTITKTGIRDNFPKSGHHYTNPLNNCLRMVLVKTGAFTVHEGTNMEASQTRLHVHLKISCAQTKAQRTLLFT